MQVFFLAHLEMLGWLNFVELARFVASQAVLDAWLLSCAGSSSGSSTGVVGPSILKCFKGRAASSCLGRAVSRPWMLTGCLLGHCFYLIELTDAEIALELLSCAIKPHGVARNQEVRVLQDVQFRHWCLSSSEAVGGHEVARASELVSSGTLTLADVGTVPLLDLLGECECLSLS